MQTRLSANQSARARYLNYFINMFSYKGLRCNKYERKNITYKYVSHWICKKGISAEIHESLVRA